ncbi:MULTISPECIES: 4-hydroxy-tetrahydrodipicolinate reductase [Mesonia]|uniref:4-hydroxy-tetrahydrodipicolinate reductase n=1 Tax=Mesonia oceanica TaxID=2687242 RepID=A0AC61YBD3_9FLAO|nr:MULTISPECIES: 4-hydroxy-tetrahydrodipicolinate reductase [Mesonia]MAN29093.1 4-hydroxy-tetrahydrodipicolinate reductase [Mesonia sp.]MAQ41817.1 4-hydroxy-tetrahydrodipicolinate reductase [Mesonia sp.]MBJ98327.1 4-hydroxy-tetrahydrodipicolinate reductase [Flavobacteriaceae bacterium]VVV01761.1 4-hydroxy-tetrahydrodipicolinate reductase [Mesonia oceanica]
MKIAILGYGRMGKTIEQIALDRNHEIVYKTSEKINTEELQKAEVAIDFSIPDAAFENITTCFKNNIPVVSGTTGWLDRYEEAVKICNENKGAFIYASNFSLGVNLFFQLNENLAKLMSKFKEYTVAIEEIHHTKKLDKPSGTAITLTESILPYTQKEDWKLVEEDEKASANQIPVVAKREEDVKGTHSIKYSSAIDDIEIKHTAHSREGFALGAVIAAEWLSDKTGVFTMKDVLGL